MTRSINRTRGALTASLALALAITAVCATGGAAQAFEKATPRLSEALTSGKAVARKMPGRTKYGSITLKRGIVQKTPKLRSATAQASGRRTYEPIRIRKRIDSTSPVLAKPNSTSDMTPWEKFCFNIHKDDFTPDGYVACVNGWVE